ncbi:hypothetical protein DQ244_04760 [Blastococcus sp. TBT05-19]|uniref:hypothetical protein n=1 Tax=Blastococcus sp. TBT05-19 TaxID=2250581 RepID=UPI000DEBE9F3|nr:hypothetical protein [Blastococcus sp. TBT05-19]RBY94604.1 hypothetical protein DQ244_04760 [Blastococcus sp. TBT05-19]
MTTQDPAAEGRRRAEALLAALSDGEDDAVDALLGGLTEVRDLVYVGAGLTAIARAEGRALPTAQRAQASTRQLRLGQLRDANRDDPAGLRTWLRRGGEEILFIRSLQAAVDRLA